MVSYWQSFGFLLIYPHFLMGRFFALFILTSFIFLSCSFREQRCKAPANINNLQKIVYIDKSFDEDEVAAITSAIHNWECSTNHIVMFNLVYDASAADYLSANHNDSLFIIRVYSDDERIMTIDNQYFTKITQLHTVGLYHGDDYIPTIFLVEDRLDGHIKAITTHELGHALNLDHNDSKDSIMYLDIGEGSKRITKRDVDTFCELYGCDSDRFKACN